MSYTLDAELGWLDSRYDPIVLMREEDPGAYYKGNTREFFSLPYEKRVAILKGEGVEAFADPGTLYLDEQYSAPAQDRSLASKVTMYAKRAGQLPGEAVQAVGEAVDSAVEGLKKTVSSVTETVSGGMPLWIKAAIVLSLVVGVAVVVKGAVK